MTQQPKPIPDTPLVEIVLSIEKTENLIELLRKGIDGLDNYIYTPNSQRQKEQVDNFKRLQANYQSILKMLLDSYDELTPRRELDLTDAVVYSQRPFELDPAGSE